MADDTERLIVLLEAKIDQFEKNMAKASRSADQNFTNMEARAKRAAASLQANMEKAAQGIVGAFSGLGNSFLGAAGVSGLGLSALFATAVKLNGELAKIPGLAREAGLSTDRIQEIKFAANMKGVGDEEFTASMRTSLGLLDEAQRQVNTLSRLFNANGLSIKDSNGQLIQFDTLLERAAQLMLNARNEQEKIKVAEMLGLSREWVRVLRDGPESFRAAAAEAQNAGAVIDKETVQRAKDFDVAWTRAIVKFKAGMVDGLSELSRAFGEFWNDLIDDVPGGNFLRDAFAKWAGGLRGMSLPELEDALQRSVEQGVGNIEIDRIQAEIDRRLGKEPLKVTVTPEVAGPETVIPKDKQKNPFDSAVFEANKRIAALDAETASIGLNSAERERNKLVAVLQEAAIKANTEAGYQSATVTDVQRAKIERLGDAMAAAAQRAHDSHEALMRFAVEGGDFVRQFDSVAISTFGNFENAFAGIITGTKDAKAAFSDMATSILNDLTKMMVRMMITAPLASALGGAFGGGGLIGSLFGSAKGNAFDQGRVTPFARGGVINRPTLFPMANGAGLMGEAGPEAVMPLMRLPSGKLGVSAPGGGSKVTVNSVVNNHHSGADVQQNVTDDGNGGITIETVVGPIENALADRMTRGRGSLGKASRGLPSGRLLRG